MGIGTIIGLGLVTLIGVATYALCKAAAKADEKEKKMWEDDGK